MKTGLLWYDGDPKRPLEDKVRAAARRHQLKYDRWPDTCYVHPQEEPGPEMRVMIRRPGPSKYVPPVVVRVLAIPTTLPAHLWIGCKEIQNE